MTDIHGNVCTHQNIGGRASTTSAVNGELDNSFRSRVVGDYNPLINHPRINNIELIGNKTSADLGIPYVFYDTTANWDSQSTLITIEGAIYVYSDYKQDELGRNIPGIKVGDGITNLIDLPFVVNSEGGGGSGDVSQIKIGNIIYNPVDGVITLPSYPTVNDGSLTIKQNGTTIQTFSANQAASVIADIIVPTKVSELTNDSGYTSNVGTVTGVKIGNTSYSPTDGLVDLPEYPTVPTKVSELINDSGYTSNEGTVTGVKVGNTPYSPTDGIVQIPEYPDVPTKVSELINDSGYTSNTGTVTTVKVGNTPYESTDGVVSLPAYPTDTNTHRPIHVDDSEILGDNVTPLNLKGGDNVTLSNSGGNVTINATDTTYESKPGVENGMELSLVTTGEKYYWNHIGGGGGGGTVTSIATGAGLTGGTITMSGTIKANLKSETPSILESGDITAIVGKQYAVGLDSNGVLSVNVPWLNTTYTEVKETINSANVSSTTVMIDGLVKTFEGNSPTTIAFAPDSCNLIINNGTPSRLITEDKVVIMPVVSVTPTEVVTSLTTN